MEGTIEAMVVVIVTAMVAMAVVVATEAVVVTVTVVATEEVAGMVDAGTGAAATLVKW